MNNVDSLRVRIQAVNGKVPDLVTLDRCTCVINTMDTLFSSLP